MAKQKAKIRYYDAPKQAPEGMEYVDVKRTVGKLANVVIRALVPKGDASGLVGGVKFLSGILASDGPDGTVAAAEAFRTWWITSQVAQHVKMGEDGDPAIVGTTVPRVAPLRVVDKAAVAGDRLVAFITEHGRPPTVDENKEIYAGLAL